MKRIVIILVGLIGIAYGQSNPTSAKTRFVNGLYVGTKLDTYFAAADSNAIYWRADSVVMAKYKGMARALLFAVSGGYIPYSDTTSLFSQVVRTFGTQTVGGNKTFSNDIVVNSLTVGRGAGSISSNTAVGSSSLNVNTSGTSNTAIGANSLASNVSNNQNTAIGTSALILSTADRNTAIGANALQTNLTGERNTAIGAEAGVYFGAGTSNNTASSSSIYIGHQTASATATSTNQIVIGNSAISNGSNTVTIGNSSITNNYFSGNIRSSNGTAFLKNMANGSSSDSVIVSNNGELRKIAQSSIGSGLYLPLSGGTLTGGLNGTIGVFNNYVQVTKATDPSLYLNNTAIQWQNKVNSSNHIVWNDAISDKLILAYSTGSLTLGSTVGTGSGALFAGAGTFTGSLNGTSLSMSGAGSFGTTSGGLVVGTSTIEAFAKFKVRTGTDNNLAVREVSGVLSFDAYNDATSANIPLRYYALSHSFNGGNTLIKTTTDNGTDALQVAGSGLFTGAVEALFYKASGVPIVGYGGTTAQFAPNSYWQGIELQTNGSARLTINSTGAVTASSSVTASSLIKSGGTSTQALIADGSVQTLTSGTYTPTITNGTNVSSSTSNTAQYSRVGDVVTVSGEVSITTTSNSTLTDFQLSLPISSNFAIRSNCGGVAKYYNAADGDGVSMAIIAEDTNDRAKFIMKAPAFGSGGGITVTYQFTYRVI